MTEFTDRFNTAVTNVAEEEYENIKEFTTYIGDIPVDLVEEATPSRKWNLTHRKISGENRMTDHREKDPDRVVMTILLADEEDGSRTFTDKVNELEEFAEIDQLVELVTPWRVYPSMVIVGLDPLPSKDTGNGINYLITLEEAIFGEVSMSTIDPKMIPKRRKGKKKPSPEAIQKEFDLVHAGTQVPYKAGEAEAKVKYGWGGYFDAGLTL